MLICRTDRDTKNNIDYVLNLFPRLKDHLNRQGGFWWRRTADAGNRQGTYGESHRVAA